MDALTARRHRTFGCNILSEAGITLKLENKVTLTSQVLLQRFLFQESLYTVDAFAAAMGCLIVATKASDTLIPIRDIVKCMHGIMTKRKGSPEPTIQVGSQQFTEWKATATSMELLVLQKLGFCVYELMKFPHEHVSPLTAELEVEAITDLALQLAGKSVCTDLVVRFPPRVLAAAVTYWAALKSGQWLPDERWSTLKHAVPPVQQMRDMVDALDSYCREDHPRWVVPLCSTKLW